MCQSFDKLAGTLQLFSGIRSGWNKKAELTYGMEYIKYTSVSWTRGISKEPVQIRFM